VLKLAELSRRCPGNSNSSRLYSRCLFSRQNLTASLVNSLRITLSVQPNSSLVANSFAATTNSSRGQLSRIMWASARLSLVGEVHFHPGRALSVVRPVVCNRAVILLRNSREMIRQATANDIPAIRSLMESAPGFWQPDWSNDTLTKAISSASGLAFVWETRSHILGFVCAHDVGFRAYLSELVAAQQARNQRIGKQLVGTVEQELSRRGQAVLIADVWHAAVPFYRSLGREPPDVILLRRKIEREDTGTDCS
jgi:predicted N-acetyltransferase YhbS